MVHFFPSSPRVINDPVLNILAWNIHGELDWMLRDPEVLDLFSSYDIILLQETWLLEGEELSLPIPGGYTLWSSPRPDLAEMEKQGGGLAVLFRTGMPITWCRELSSSECMVLDLPTLTIVLVYLPPYASPWLRTLVVDPLHFLSGVLGIRTLLLKPLLLLGDCNARTASLSSLPSIFARWSVDPNTDTRGRWLVEECRANELAILNGSSYDSSPQSDTDSGWTSFQPNGRAVVDYAAISMSALHLVQDFAVSNWSAWSDHAFLSISLSCDAETVLSTTRRRFRLPRSHKPRTSPFIALPSLDDLPPELRGPPSALDLLYQALVSDRDSDTDGELIELYGHASTTGSPCTVWVAGVCILEGSPDAQAGAGVFWGLNATRNMSMRVPGSQTTVRATHWAIIFALLLSLTEFELIIVTDQVDIIRTYCCWAASLQQEGWICRDGDVIQYAVRLLQARSGRVEFRLLRSGSSTHPIQPVIFVKELAFDGAIALSPSALPPLPPRRKAHTSLHLVCIAQVKVFTSLPHAPQPARDPEPLPPLPDTWSPSVHNSRRRELRQRQWELNNSFIDACRASEPMFWSTIRDFTDPKPVESNVDLASLAMEFESRMRVPDTLPPDFNRVALELAALESSAIPAITVDRTPKRSFSRHWVLADIKLNRERLTGRMRSSPGFDTTTYGLFMALSEEALLQFFNMCMDLRSAPRWWMVIVLVGILKPGKDPSNPSSYRLIGLEACLMKMFTLLWDDRFREWMEDEGILPDTQNGFRRGYHGLNNLFILRCAIETALALGRPLFVVLPDLSNAFPSTDHSSLWTQMYKAGVAGPLFDWLRAMYSGMRYCVRRGEASSHFFASNMGILAGDSTSPSVWNFFGSDFRPCPHPDDVYFGDRPVLNVEHADDGALWSTSVAGVQFHCDEYGPWASSKGLLINFEKTKVLSLMVT